MKTRTNRKIRPYRVARRPLNKPVLVDANVILYLLPDDYEDWEDWELEDYARFYYMAQAAMAQDDVEIPGRVFDEIKRWAAPEHTLRPLRPYAVNDVPAGVVDSFVKTHGERMLPRNVSLVDKALIVQAQREKKYVLSLDAWVVGKAQAMGLIHPALESITFGGEQSRKRWRSSFRRWAGFNPPDSDLE